MCVAVGQSVCLAYFLLSSSDQEMPSSRSFSASFVRSGIAINEKSTASHWLFCDATAMCVGDETAVKSKTAASVRQPNKKNISGGPSRPYLSLLLFLVCLRRRWLRSFAYAHAPVRGSSQTTAHIGRPHSVWSTTLVTDRSALICSVWADLARYMGIGVVNE